VIRAILLKEASLRFLGNLRGFEREKASESGRERLAGGERGILFDQPSKGAWIQQDIAFYPLQMRVSWLPPHVESYRSIALCINAKPQKVSQKCHTALIGVVIEN
jgi:hypothetical protein